MIHQDVGINIQRCNHYLTVNTLVEKRRFKFFPLLADTTGDRVGTKYREQRTEPNLPRTEPKFNEPKYSVPCSVPSLQEPKYRDKYRNRTELTELTKSTEVIWNLIGLSTEVIWNLIGLSVIILLIALLYTIILCNFGTHTYIHVTFICMCILHHYYLWNHVKISFWTCYYIFFVINSVPFGKYRNRTEFTDTEHHRYRVSLGTDRYRFLRNRIYPSTGEPNRSVR
jgi:hypothetical protein